MHLTVTFIKAVCALGVFGFAFYGAWVIGLWAVVAVIVMCIIGTDTDIWGSRGEA